MANGIGYTPGWLPDGSLANQFTVSSITLNGTTATVTLNNTSTGFSNGEEVHLDGAAQTQYDGDFTIANVTVNSAAGTTTFTCTVSGSPASPATAVVGESLTAGVDSEFETLESGATATWSASSLASASYTVYAHVNLYDGDNNLLSDQDSQAQYTVTWGSTSWTVVVDQDQVPATLSVTSLTYNNTSGLVTAAANNALVNNNSLVAGSIVHISGATPSQFDGTFVVQSATSTSFTYALASGLSLASATGTITAGLNDVRISLGTYTLSGEVSVELTRTSNAHPGEWTIAGGMELVSSSQQTTVLGTPAFNASYPVQPTATLAPGAYAVLVSNYAAFEERYNPTGNSNILVLGVYTGHLSNGGDTVDIYQIGNRAGGDVAAENGYVLSYRVDHVNYNNAAPWPIQPDSNGSALIRVNTADYGNDAINWEASNVGGTPGQANLVLDPSAPSIPANLSGYGVLSPTPEVSLTWNASSAPRSSVAYYVIYRDGSSIGTSATTSFADTTAAYGTNYTYSVAAVNRDGYASAASASIALALPSMFSSAEPSATQIVLYFSEPLTASVASTVSNYAVSGRTVSAVALARDNTEVTLTLSSAMTLATAYTVTMTNLTTVSGDPLAATLTFTFTYETQGTGSILWRYYANIGSGTAVSNLTSAITYPNVPTTTAAETSFEAPHSTGNTNYGETLSGYVYPPTTGYYIFTIASDDSSQLWLSTNNSPAGLVEIAWVSTSTGYRQWSNASNPEQTSTSIYLTAGTPYYILALEKHGTDSGDNLSVRWEIPATTGGPASTWELNSSGVADPTIPIPGIRLAPPPRNWTRRRPLPPRISAPR